MRFSTCIWVAVIFVGCSTGDAPRRTFDQELQLTLKAGRGELTEAEKRQLLDENHPILAQVGDPNASKVVQMFSRLSEADRRRLLNESYVKWRLSDLDESTQRANEEMIRMVVEMRTGTTPFPPNLPVEERWSLLEQTEVGFAVVEIKQSQQKVVSWFAFGPRLPVPLWATVVNSDAAGSAEYVQAHIQRLPLLRSMKSSAPPKLQLPPSVTTSMV